jgi:hypothetical protein
MYKEIKHFLSTYATSQFEVGSPLFSLSSVSYDTMDINNKTIPQHTKK